MGERYLIDTNIIIDFSENKLPAKVKSFIAFAIDNEPHLSVINKIELLGFSSVTKNITEFVNAANVIPLSDEIIEKTITIRKTHRIKLPDAIIAATAVLQKLILLTSNDSDFKNIKGLKVVNPKTIQ
ncbi:MAG: type toxin-antitoxin system VapC family toxin [Flavipsychrobacter sp.]|jgi:predicted nucleic acid-binding protein|nr:type toxin-antitoxin system VapC family toxin [Flavipsychrobacter sp.]